MIRVLLFGRLRDVAGWREASLEASPMTLAGLRRAIAERWPDLAEALAGPGVQAAVDRVLAVGDAPLAAGAEVAFMPPMSGG